MVMNSVNEFDLALVVDTTGSMGSFINQVKKDIVALLTTLSKRSDVDIKVGLVQYLDHPPEDSTLTINHPFGSISELQNAVKNINLGSGGDEAEAVLDGIDEAVALKWRKHSRRIIVLVGDSPPHGFNISGDHWPKGCPCGKTLASVANNLEEKSISVYSICCSSADLSTSFGKLSTLTGGEYFQANDAKKSVGRIEEILQAEFSNIETDKIVLSSWDKFDEIIKSTGLKKSDVLSSISRLRSRDLV